MNPPNNHNFKFNLPLHPSESADCEVKMDGQDLQGVSSLTVRAGSNGFTNVVVEFEANCAVEFAGALIAKIDPDDPQGRELFAGVYDKALETFPIIREFHMDAMDKEEIVRTIIQQVIERLK